MKAGAVLSNTDIPIARRPRPGPPRSGTGRRRIMSPSGGTRRFSAIVTAVALIASVTSGNVGVASAATSRLPAVSPRADNLIPTGKRPEAVAVDPSTHTVYIANQLDGTMTVVDESGDSRSGTVTATIPVCGHVKQYEGSPLGVAVDPSTHDVYVSCDDPSVVWVIDESGDARNGTRIATLDTGGDFPWGIVFDPSTRDLYVVNGNSENVAVIDESGDARNGTVIDTFFVGYSPSGLALDPSTHRLLVEACRDVYCGVYGFSVIDVSGDARNDTKTGFIPVPYSNLGNTIAVDPSTHDFYVAIPAYVASSAARTSVAVIDESGDARNGTVTATVRMPHHPEAVTVNPSTHDVYVTLADGEMVPIGAPADLSMAVHAPSAAADGTRFSETLTVTDHGPTAAAGTVTNAFVPSGLSVVSAPGATLRSGTLVWDDGILASGATVTHTLTFTVGPGVDSVVPLGGDTAPASFDPDQADNAAITTITVP